MIRKLPPVVLFLLTGFGLASRAQYTGGAGNSSSGNMLATSVCILSANANIWFGGGAGGASFHLFQASSCPPVSNGNIYFGGNADGQAYHVHTASICPLPPNTNIWFGGDADGYSFHFLPGLIDPCLIILDFSRIFFSGACDNQNKILSWTTPGGSGKVFFTVEYSADTRTWETAGAITGAGNSAAGQSFSLTDPKPRTGVSFYRLKQTDPDGKFIYSNTISIAGCAETRGSLSIYPNPSSGICYILSGAGLAPVSSIEVFNAAGEKILHADGHPAQIDLSDKPPGTYFVYLHTPAQTFIRKILIEKL